MEQIKRHLRANKLTLEWLADRIGLSRHTIKKWDKVPPHHVLQVEDALGGAVTRYQMRPDIFGASPATSANDASDGIDTPDRVSA